MKKLMLFSPFFFALTTFAQVGIGTNTPNTSAQLEVNSTNKGFLPPRIALTSTTDVSTITTPATGLLIYNTATAGNTPNNITPGFYYFNGISWIRISNVSKLDDLIDAKFDGSNFIGSLLIGNKATGTLNAASGNTGIGQEVFSSLTTGDGNTATGNLALSSNTTGNYNTASGYAALLSNTTGNQNVAQGGWALGINTTGYGNNAIGHSSLYYNTTGFYNTATGTAALYSNTTGNDNTSTGSAALYSNTIGRFNTASGTDALFSNISGNYNTALGTGALYNNTTGNDNTAIGYSANVSAGNLSNSTAIGAYSEVTSSNTIQLGNADITDVKTSGKITSSGVLSSGIGGFGTITPNASAQVEISSDSKGFLTPRMSLTQRNAISSPATGLLIFQTDNNPGFYYYTGNQWFALQSAASMLQNIPSYGNVYLTIPIATTFASMGTPVKLLGTTTLATSSNVSSPTNNRLVNTGINGVFSVSANLSVTQTNDNRYYTFYIAKNGIILYESMQEVKAVSSTGTYNVSLGTTVTLNTNDYVEIWVANQTSTTNLTAQFFNLQMHKIN